MTVGLPLLGVLLLLGGPVRLVGLETVGVPGNGSGFAAAIVPAIIIVVVLVLLARWVSSRPKDRRRR